MAGAADLRALNTCHRVSHSLNHAGRRDDERLYLTRNDRPFESPGRHPEGVDDVLGPQREADRPVDRNDKLALISELLLRIAEFLFSLAGSDLDREGRLPPRSEEHTSELQSLMRISYAVFCLKKKTNTK